MATRPNQRPSSRATLLPHASMRYISAMSGVLRGRLLHALLVACLVVTGLLSLHQADTELTARTRAQAHRPQERTAADYAGSNACRACHPQAYTSWRHSYHRTMTKPGTPEFVKAPFSGERLQQAGQTFALQRTGERFVVEISELDPDLARAAAFPPGRWPIALVTGSHHMQIFWYESGQGRTLGQLPFAFLLQDKRWVPRAMIFLQPPQPLSLNELGRWNDTCIHCHTTRGEPLPQKDGTFASAVSELGIACEACHGPAAAHVAQLSAPDTRYARQLGLNVDLKIHNPRELGAQRGSEVCSQCHALWLFDQAGQARWAEHGMDYRPGDNPEETMWLFAPSRAAHDARIRYILKRQPSYSQGQFWSDGQARVSGREYSGMIDSACASGELSCMSCHSMHQSGADPRPVDAWADDQLAFSAEGQDGDSACLQCHVQMAKNPSAHTRHAEQSAGSRCQNCHMPYTSYGLLKAIRSHKITIPSAQETAATGRPNACNLCHLDRSLSWTATALTQRFDFPQQVNAAGNAEGVALAAELALRGNAAQRAIVAWALGWPPARDAAADKATPATWSPALLGVLMDDPYDAVRYIAGHSLHSFAAFADFEYDYTTRPAQRAAIADIVAERARRLPGPVPATIPLTATHTLNDTGKRLLSQRDHTPIRLLE